MAELRGGTTIGGYKAWHAGNDGENSGLDADKIKGVNFTVSKTPPPNPKIGDIWIQVDKD